MIRGRSAAVSSPTVYRGPRFCIDYVAFRGRPAGWSTAAIAFDQPAADDPGLYPSDHLGLVDLEISSAGAGSLRRLGGERHDALPDALDPRVGHPRPRGRHARRRRRRCR